MLQLLTDDNASTRQLVALEMLRADVGAMLQRLEDCKACVRQETLEVMSRFEPAALMEVYVAVQQGKPILPICLIGRGYDFKDAQAHLGDLEGRLAPQKRADPLAGLRRTGDAHGRPACRVAARACVVRLGCHAAGATAEQSIRSVRL